MSTILVTGRNGFIGQELTPVLKKEHRIISIVRQAKEHMDYSGEELIVNDIRNVGTEDVRRHHIHVIVHLAAKIRGKTKAIEENNITSSKAIFNIAESLKIPVVFLSSTNVLFQDVLGRYTRSKRICEDLLKRLSVNYLIIRVPLVIGENSLSMQSIRKFYEKFRFFPLFGRQEGKVQPIHVSSFNKVLLAKINEATFLNETLTIVGKEVYTYHEIIEKVINPKNCIHFLKIPFLLSILATRFFEMINIPFFVSSEEIKSVNMNKDLEPDGHNNIYFVDNDKKILFA